MTEGKAADISDYVVLNGLDLAIVLRESGVLQAVAPGGASDGDVKALIKKIIPLLAAYSAGPTEPKDDLEREFRRSCTE